ncbi:hypothetical protein [Caulobacter endophyticus]|uniref:hypothetical protein n=1 Tax=Caulobacter endophyticus TaxID=2172652 RepID=UPI0024100466|nr:hypothetical protein [Caulobacter endophyticus]MDG2531008.1 hypothetical protein [Caulobacter endophyticus]
MGALTSLLAALGAMVGGAAMWLWSANAPDAALKAVAAVPSVSDAMIDKARDDMAREGWILASLKGPLTSTPYKVYAALAPQAGAGLPVFAAAALPVRLPRFLLVAAAFSLIGAIMRGRVGPRTLLAVFTAGWVLFYGWFWMTRPG